MGNKFGIFILMIIVCGAVFAWEIDDLNGTYVEQEEFLKSPHVHREFYSWGRGRTMPNASIDFDLDEGSVKIPRMGLCIIDSIWIDDEGSICVNTFYREDKDLEDPVNLKVTFIDSNKLYIVCNKWESWHNKFYSPEEKWVWYRLSGPVRN